MATDKDNKATRNRKPTDEPRKPQSDKQSSEQRNARKKTTDQSGTAEDLFWGGSNDQGEVQ